MALLSPILWEPSADEQRVRDAAALWQGFAGHLECTLADLAGTAHRVTTEHEGTAIDAFAGYWAGLAGPGDAHLTDLVVACRAIAAALDAYAEALAEIRRQLLELAATIAAAIALGAALSWATAGISAVGAASTVTAATVQASGLAAVLASRATTIPRLVALHATIGALEGLATYAVIEPLRIATFHPNEDPFGSFALTEAAAAAAGGAVIPGWRAVRGGRRALSAMRSARVDAGRSLPPVSQAAAGSPLRLQLPPEVSWGSTRKLQKHFDDHAADFGSTNPEGYAEEAAAFLERGLADGLPVKVTERGIIRVYEPGTNTFGSYNANGTTRTFFKPSSGVQYWQRQGGEPR